MWWLMKLKWINEDHVILVFSDDISLEVKDRITAYQEALQATEGIKDVVCAYNEIMVAYDTDRVNIQAVVDHLCVNVPKIEKKIIRVPVCYEPPYGLDTKEVCRIHGIDLATLIDRHTKPLYPVYMMGFVPGFPYLGGLDESLHTPRRKNPRTKIPKGAVGIGGKQTGIYPCSSPGGWQIIGQTPLDLLDIKANDSLIHRGDYVTFYPVDVKTFESILKEVNHGS